MGNKFKITINEDIDYQSNLNGIRALFRDTFQGISERVLDRHIKFVELLENYDGNSIYGVKSFLEENNFIQVGIKYINSKNTSFTKHQKEKIMTGEYHLAIKIFYSKSKNNSVTLDKYFIIGKKKDHIILETTKIFISDLIFGFLNKKGH